MMAEVVVVPMRSRKNRAEHLPWHAGGGCRQLRVPTFCRSSIGPGHRPTAAVPPIPALRACPSGLGKLIDPPPANVRAPIISRPKLQPTLFTYQTHNTRPHPPCPVRPSSTPPTPNPPRTSTLTRPPHEQQNPTSTATPPCSPPPPPPQTPCFPPPTTRPPRKTSSKTTRTRPPR